MHQKVKSVRKAADKKAPAKKSGGVKGSKTGFILKNASFKSEGLNCDAKLFVPKDVKKPPVIIMAHGFGAEMIFGIPAYAEKFAANGFAVLTFDYRYFGRSEGKPAHLISPAKQLKDWEAAIEFARTLEDVDGERICIWGCSYSGGHAFVTAARNNNVKAFIAMVPFMDALYMLKISGVKKILKFNVSAYRDIFNSLTGRTPCHVPIIGRPDEPAVLNTPECYDGYMSTIPAGYEWKNEMPARTILEMTWYRPFKQISKIKCSGLVILAENDSLTDFELAERSFRDMKNISVLKYPCGHFNFFEGEYFKKAADEELRFLKRIFG